MPTDILPLKCTCVKTLLLQQIYVDAFSIKMWCVKSKMEYIIYTAQKDL